MIWLSSHATFCVSVLINLMWPHGCQMVTWDLSKALTHKRPISQIQECTCSISHNAPLRTEMCTFLFWMKHCGIWNSCILEFVNQANFVWGVYGSHSMCWPHVLPHINQETRDSAHLAFIQWKPRHLWIIKHLPPASAFMVIIHHLLWLHTVWVARNKYNWTSTASLMLTLSNVYSLQFII